MAVGESPIDNEPDLDENTPFQCPSCRQRGEPILDAIRDRYHQLFEGSATKWVPSKLYHFNEQQKEILMGFKRVDFMFEKRMKQWKMVSAIKKGTPVIIRNLKNRPDLNGKLGKIAGRKETRKGVTRWPMKLVDATNKNASQI